MSGLLNCSCQTSTSGLLNGNVGPATFLRAGRVGGRGGGGGPAARRLSGEPLSRLQPRPSAPGDFGRRRARWTAAAASRPIGSRPASACRSCCRRFPARPRGPRTSRWRSSTRTSTLVVVNKPPGMVVHPARGHWSGTLASALQFHFGPTLSTAGGASRPGIVHRLDRDTSGVILVARNDQAHCQAGQAVRRPVDREGVFRLGCGLSAARPRLDRLPDRLPSARAREDGHPPRRRREPAGQTFYEVLERFDGFAAVQAAAEDGPDAPDSRPPEPHRLPGAVRSAVRRPEPDHARRDPPRSDRRARCCWSVRRCTPGGCGSSIRPPASRWRSRPRCRPTSRRCSPSCGSTGGRLHNQPAAGDSFSRRKVMCVPVVVVDGGEVDADSGRRGFPAARAPPRSSAGRRRACSATPSRVGSANCRGST